MRLNPLRGRRNIEIYDMPAWMAGRRPPLVPPPGISVALYTYKSGRPEDPANGISYPMTADRQPTFVLAKRAATDDLYSRAFCGFEPWRLTLRSHLALADYVLLQVLRVGQAHAR